MNVPPVDVSGWIRFHSDRNHPFWWGILGLIAIEVTVIATFLTGFFYLWIVNVKERGTGWPPGGTDPLPLVYPTIDVLLLVLCSVGMYYGGIGVQRGRNRVFVWWVVVTCIASLLVAFLRFLQFKELGFTWRKNTYASFVWVLTGFHLFHVVSALLGTAVIGWLAAKGYYTEQRRLGVQVDTIYWYFVSAIWVPIYVVLYWAPRWI